MQFEPVRCHNEDLMTLFPKILLEFYTSTELRRTFKVVMLSISLDIKNSGVFLFSLVQYKRLDYIGYVYPVWGEVVGLMLAFSSMLCIPGYAIYKYYVTPGTFRQVDSPHSTIIDSADIVCMRCKLLFRPDIDIQSEIRKRQIRESGTNI
ncbi:SLC6A1 [Cordylochernes scorpioides]|uniref:SLC6A1 n=1 Tax=Cordylochernes scorpioides TaxID=51811 RepID=A0ABY6KYW9_9ARAC|nr:SLC6A1 [Cordylochernes scorpioides]